MDHIHSDHLFEYRSVERRKLILSLIITLIGMVLETIGGVWTHSMALISDAGHMFTHAFAIALSLIAIRFARSAPCHHRTFGLFRAEVLAAFINGLFLLPVVGIIVYEAVLRILHGKTVLFLPMLIVALAGLVVNGISILLLSGTRKNDLNVKSVLAHLTADALSSVGVILGALVIKWTGWNVIDPILSIVIAAAILLWAWSVLKDSARILLEMTPEGITIDDVTDDLKQRFPEIRQLSRVHFWTIAPDMVVFSAYMTLRTTDRPDTDCAERIQKINRYLLRKYNVIESTIQMVS